ncbi:MAG: mannose-1-phosphate guanylyltransferase/mannose-6-phosphate isomerase [Sphingomonadales bacterium]|nr:mannose-1-phosphate guanylyltransferase/mannose-6-phosphate isomerase [Sphingomonadales bacterium]
MIHILMSGGSGTRLWPLSRLRMPKQYLPLVGGHSLFECTVWRHFNLCSSHIVVTNASQFALAKRQMGQAKATYILESVGRNTAPAIGMACRLLPEESVVLVTPSDHLIRDEQAYHAAALKAAEFAKQGYLVTFGVEPEYPEPGFGYIQAEGSMVVAFKEKPDTTTAASYIQQGGYYWNAGIFCFQAGVYLQELERLAPDLHRAIMESPTLRGSSDKDQCYRTSLEEMMAMADISIDYAVLEHSDKVRVVPCRMGWSDLGSFDALDAEFSNDQYGNTMSSPNCLTLNANNNLLLNFGSQKLVVQGMDNILVVNTEDSIYIGQKGQSQGLREVVKVLQKEESPLLQSHLELMTTYGSLRLIEHKESTMVLELKVDDTPKTGLVLNSQDLMDHPHLAKALQSSKEAYTLRCLSLDRNNFSENSQAVSLKQWNLAISAPGEFLLIIQKSL